MNQPLNSLKKIGIAPRDIDFVILTHMHTDLVSAPELEDTKKFPIRYVKSMWDGINFETFDFEDTGIGPVGKSLDFFGDGTFELINIPGHTSGLTAVKINVNEKFVLLFSDGGYAKKSYENLIPPGTALDENCIEALANHDAGIIPHTIEL